MPDVSKLILMADDDADDCLLAEHALEASQTGGNILCVEDGVELLDYLLHRGQYEGSTPPAVLLLDLNMPRKDGRQALKEIRALPAFKDLPIIIFTTSREEKDIIFSRKMGADEFITKPSAFEDWVEIMRSLVTKWMDGQT